MLLHTLYSDLSPLALQRPSVKFGDRHKGDYKQFAGQVRPVKLCSGISPEEVGYDIGVHNYRGHASGF